MSDLDIPGVMQLPAAVRIAQSQLTDVELAFIHDALTQHGSEHDHVNGWSVNSSIRLDADFAEASKIRGIKNGVRVVTQTVDLRS